MKYPICWNSGCPNNCCYIDSRIPDDCPYKKSSEELKKSVRGIKTIKKVLKSFRYEKDWIERLKEQDARRC